MHHRILGSVFVMTMALSAGCGGGGGETFGDKLDAINSEYATQADILCDCYASFPTPYASEAACIEVFNVAQDPVVKQCLENTEAIDPAATNARIDCELTAEQNRTNCLAQTLTCNNLMNSFLQCGDAFGAELQQCPPLPVAVQEAVAACFPQ